MSDRDPHEVGAASDRRLAEDELASERHFKKVPIKIDPTSNRHARNVPVRRASMPMANAKRKHPASDQNLKSASALHSEARKEIVLARVAASDRFAESPRWEESSGERALGDLQNGAVRVQLPRGDRNLVRVRIVASVASVPARVADHLSAVGHEAKAVANDPSVASRQRVVNFAARARDGHFRAVVQSLAQAKAVQNARSAASRDPVRGFVANATSAQRPVATARKVVWDETVVPAHVLSLRSPADSARTSGSIPIVQFGIGKHRDRGIL